MRLAHLTNDTSLDQFHHPVIILGGMNLDTHLMGAIGFGRRLADLAGFPDVVRERLLAINMLVMLEGQHGRQRMRVLARGNHAGIEFLFNIKKLSEVRNLLCIRESSGSGV